jgi:hypothetical protein
VILYLVDATLGDPASYATLRSELLGTIRFFSKPVFALTSAISSRGQVRWRPSSRRSLAVFQFRRSRRRIRTLLEALLTALVET